MEKGIGKWPVDEMLKRHIAEILKTCAPLQWDRGLFSGAMESYDRSISFFPCQLPIRQEAKRTHLSCKPTERLWWDGG